MQLKYGGDIDIYAKIIEKASDELLLFYRLYLFNVIKLNFGISQEKLKKN